MVFAPPRHGKSEIISVQFPAWLMGKNRDRQIILASYASELASYFGRQTRNLIASQDFKNAFCDVSLSEDSQSANRWNTNGRGAYIASGVGGGITGHGADILLIDDPLRNRQDADSETVRKAQWDWYRSTARTRLMPNGAIVIILTRWHDDDLAGKILKNDPKGWEILNLPAIAEEDEKDRKKGQALWPKRYPLEELEKIRKDIGTYEFSALYQGKPIDEANQEFKLSWVKSIEQVDVDKMETMRYMSVDTAISKGANSDSTGIVINYVNRENKWHLKSYRMKINASELINMLFSLHESHNFDKIGVEKTIYLEAIKPFLDQEQRRRNRFLPIFELQHNQQHKETRIRGLIPRYQSGSVYHIKQNNMSLCSELEEEMVRFPKGVHDDVIDAAAYLTQMVEDMPLGGSETLDTNYDKYDLF